MSKYDHHIFIIQSVLRQIIKQTDCFLAYIQNNIILLLRLLIQIEQQKLLGPASNYY